MSAQEALETGLRDLILRGLGQQYTSVATTTGSAIEAGNHYQSVDLGGTRTRGFRDDRAEFLDQIDFTGKKVLDLGSNLGELSREARARGAALVDGFEYDPYFIEIAELVNALNGTTRVSFYQRDVGDPEIYTEHYDMVLAFAVMGQGAANSMWRIAEITDVLVLETHRLEGNFEDGYMAPVSRWFPYHRMLGESDWGVTFDRQEVRATMVFAKTPEALEGALLDAVPVLPEASSRGRRDATADAERHLDVSRTLFQEKFFNTFNFASTEDLLAAVEGIDVDVAALARSHDARVEGYDGWVLWFVFLKGYLEYARSGEVGAGNTYHDYLSAYHDQSLDPAVGLEVGDDSTREYIMRQFEGMDRMRAAPESPELVAEIPPIQVFTSEQATDGLRVYEPGRTNPIVATRADGWHRLFAAKLFGVPQLRLEVVEEFEPQPIFGALEDLEFTGERLRVSGWCLHAENRVDLVEARLDRRYVVGNTATTYRRDIAHRFDYFAGHTGFEIDQELSAGQREIADTGRLTRFELVALEEWMPIGEISAFHLPGMFDVPWPDAGLAERLMGTGDPRRLSIDALRRLHAMLEPVKRYRDVESFSTALDWGCRAGFLEAFLGHFIPHVEVTAIDTDAEAIEWARAAGRRGAFSVVDPDPPTGLQADSFDLVLGHGTLARLTAVQQAAWLEELRRVMRPGGYALLSLNGELLRPFIKDEGAREEVEARGISSTLLGSDAVPRGGTFQTKDHSIREYAKTFDVMRYAVGALNDEDLIVLRKA